MIKIIGDLDEADALIDRSVEVDLPISKRQWLMARRWLQLERRVRVLDAGDVIVPEDIHEEYDVSLDAFIEACQSLVKDGVLESVRCVGFVVC